MIRVNRGIEPDILKYIRHKELNVLRGLRREPLSDEIKGYREVAKDIWEFQCHKCCYCETRVPRGFNDVEHFRPKAQADRRPGCTKTHGYWWLAFSWNNLLYACPGCNRSNKNSSFPLEVGSVSLVAEDKHSHNEIPLLLDPASKTINPIEHIQFVYESINPRSSKHWWARPRNNSILGNKTIEVCGLNRDELRELRQDYYTTIIEKKIEALNEAIIFGDINTIHNEFKRALMLLTPRNIHIGLTYDALQSSIKDITLKNLINIGWPSLDKIPNRPYLKISPLDRTGYYFCKITK